MAKIEGHLPVPAEEPFLILGPSQSLSCHLVYKSAVFPGVQYAASESEEVCQTQWFFSCSRGWKTIISPLFGWDVLGHWTPKRTSMWEILESCRVYLPPARARVSYKSIQNIYHFSFLWSSWHDVLNIMNQYNVLQDVQMIQSSLDYIRRVNIALMQNVNMYFCKMGSLGSRLRQR